MYYHYFNCYALFNALFRRKPITYTNSLDDVKHFVDSSASCRQFVRIDCKHMRLFDDGIQFGSLVDRDNKEMLYFGGGPMSGTGENLAL